MTYRRVIPRDLFNEGNLLKCYGQLYLNLEKMGMQDSLEHLDRVDNGDSLPFIAWQDDADGSISLLNVKLRVRGELVTLKRPLNSRQPYPLWLYETEESDELRVFNDDGTFTDEMFLFLKG